MTPFFMGFVAICCFLIPCIFWWLPPQDFREFDWPRPELENEHQALFFDNNLTVAGTFDTVTNQNAIHKYASSHQSVALIYQRFSIKGIPGEDDQYNFRCHATYLGYNVIDKMGVFLTAAHCSIVYDWNALISKMQDIKTILSDNLLLFKFVANIGIFFPFIFLACVCGKMKNQYLGWLIVLYGVMFGIILYSTQRGAGVYTGVLGAYLWLMGYSPQIRDDIHLCPMSYVLSQVNQVNNSAKVQSVDIHQLCYNYFKKVTTISSPICQETAISILYDQSFYTCHGPMINGILPSKVDIDFESESKILEYFAWYHGRSKFYYIDGRFIDPKTVPNFQKYEQTLALTQFSSYKLQSKCNIEYHGASTKGVSGSGIKVSGTNELVAVVAEGSSNGNYASTISNPFFQHYWQRLLRPKLGGFIQQTRLCHGWTYIRNSWKALNGISELWLVSWALSSCIFFSSFIPFALYQDKSKRKLPPKYFWCLFLILFGLCLTSSAVIAMWFVIPYW